MRISTLVVLFAVACSETTQAPPPADVDAYLATLPTWHAFSPLLPDDDAATGAATQHDDDVDGRTYNCTSTPYSITKTPDAIATLNPDVEILWVGSLLQGRGYLGGIGSLAELPIRQRAPLTISIDLLAANNTSTVESPTSASVNQAIGALVQAATDAGHRAGSRISYNQVEYHSLAEASVRLGVSASYYGVGVTSSLEASVRANTNTVMAVYTQQMFTVSVVLPQTPGEFFSEEFTDAELQEQVNRGRIGPDNLPVFVSTIVYGRTIMFSMTAEGTAQEIKAALSIAAGMAPVGTDLSAEQRTLLETSEINIVAVGGDAANAAAIIRQGDFSAYFDEEAALTTAKPLSYTIRNLADNVTARVSETTSYNVQECVPAVINPTGRKYRIELIDVTLVEKCFLCSSTIDLGRVEFWVEDHQAVRKVVDLGEGLGGNVRLREGVPFQFTDARKEVELHFDARRDEVRIYGTMRIAFDTRTFDWLPGIVFTTTIPSGIRGSSRWNSGIPSNGWRLAIRYRVTVLADLFD